ncbi:uncharacterized protein BDZ99DRAFT_493723 [Mytilinidion resinicola]|uniref:Uncharacterized protein n=1 Tax=Mytilinidion resinicola TaxID=574789 RepID=A0A6A6Z690_9PEZI|nr:uncharacterized protein BDZ99DRAFT_493723 [Mytilinidion resinicola]KAF2815745.1 hypothetical protein BDZ99DRAFT_493723 [Mytilinidion resinicola]
MARRQRPTQRNEPQRKLPPRRVKRGTENAPNESDTYRRGSDLPDPNAIARAINKENRERKKREAAEANANTAARQQQPQASLTSQTNTHEDPPSPIPTSNPPSRRSTRQSQTERRSSHRSQRSNTSQRSRGRSGGQLLEPTQNDGTRPEVTHQPIEGPTRPSPKPLPRSSPRFAIQSSSQRSPPRSPLRPSRSPIQRRSNAGRPSSRRQDPTPPVSQPTQQDIDQPQAGLPQNSRADGLFTRQQIDEFGANWGPNPEPGRPIPQPPNRDNPALPDAAAERQWRAGIRPGRRAINDIFNTYIPWPRAPLQIQRPVPLLQPGANDNPDDGELRDSATLRRGRPGSGAQAERLPSQHDPNDELDEGRPQPGVQYFRGYREEGIDPPSAYNRDDELDEDDDVQAQARHGSRGGGLRRAGLAGQGRAERESPGRGDAGGNASRGRGSAGRCRGTDRRPSHPPPSSGGNSRTPSPTSAEIETRGYRYRPHGMGIQPLLEYQEHQRALAAQGFAPQGRQALRGIFAAGAQRQDEADEDADNGQRPQNQNPRRNQRAKPWEAHGNAQADEGIQQQLRREQGDNVDHGANDQEQGMRLVIKPRLRRVISGLVAGAVENFILGIEGLERSEVVGLMVNRWVVNRVDELWPTAERNINTTYRQDPDNADVGMWFWREDKRGPVDEIQYTGIDDDRR